jgi:hypothetical protein
MRIGQDVIGKTKQPIIKEYSSYYSGKQLHMTIEKPKIVYNFNQLDKNKKIYVLPFGREGGIYTDGENVYISTLYNPLANRAYCTYLGKLTLGTWNFKANNTLRIYEYKRYATVGENGRIVKNYKFSPYRDKPIIVYAPFNWWKRFINIRSYVGGYLDKDSYELAVALSKLTDEQLNAFCNAVPPETPNHEMRAILKATERIL